MIIGIRIAKNRIGDDLTLIDDADRIAPVMPGIRTTHTNQTRKIFLDMITPLIDTRVYRLLKVCQSLFIDGIFRIPTDVKSSICVILPVSSRSPTNFGTNST